MRRLNRISLRAKITLGIVAILLLFGLLLASMVSQAATRSLLREITKRGAIDARQVSAKAVDPLLAVDYLRLQNIVDEVKSASDDVQYAFIMDTNQTVMAHTFTGGFPVALAEVNLLGPGQNEQLALLDTGQGLIYDFAARLTVGGYPLGTARVGLSRDKVSAVTGQLLQAIFVTTGTVVLIAALCAWVFARTVTRRLNVLRERSEQLIHGRLGQPAEPAGEIRRRENFGDEFQSLAEAFDAMTHAIRNREAERDKALEALQVSERNYRDIFERAVEGIFQSTFDARYLAVNPSMARMFGYASPEEMMAAVTNIEGQLFVAPEARREMLALVEARGEISGFETRLRKKDGTALWAAISGRAVRDEHGALRHFEGLCVDITARKQAETALHEARNALDNIINSMPSVIAGVDAQGRVTQWNNRARAATGLTAQAARGRPLAEVLPRFAPHLAGLPEALAQGRPLAKDKIDVSTDDGQHYAELMVFPLEAGGPSGAVVRIDDITERVRMEEMLAQSEKMISLGGLAAGMAHEINNPLGGVVQGVQNILRRLSPELPANLRDAASCGLDLASSLPCYLKQRQIPAFLEEIRECGERAIRIVANMLAFSRNSGPRMEPASLPAILDRGVELAANDYDLKKYYDFRKIHITRDYAADLPPIPCAPMEIEQVILNLLKNAAHALAARPGPQAPAHIGLKAGLEGGLARIEIADNGAGMDDAVRQRIFEPFFTTKPAGAGTGLGLSVSYFIIQKHGGTLSVTSQPGQGATFVILLPVNPPAG